MLLRHHRDTAATGEKEDRIRSPESSPDEDAVGVGKGW